MGHVHFLTHRSRVTHICIIKFTITGWDNGLSPGRHQAIISTIAGILSVDPLGTKFSEILIEIHKFSFKKMHFKMSSEKWRSFCLSLNVLMITGILPLHPPLPGWESTTSTVMKSWLKKSSASWHTYLPAWSSLIELRISRLIVICRSTSVADVMMPCSNIQPKRAKVMMSSSHRQPNPAKVMMSCPDRQPKPAKVTVSCSNRQPKPAKVMISCWYRQPKTC